MRMFGSIIALLDLFVKFAYYDYSRFASQQIRDIYASFLSLRPILLAIVFSYNLIVGLITHV